MQSSDFNKHQGIRSSNEIKRKKRLPWDRITYLIVLTLMLAFVAYHMVNHFLWLRGKGVIMNVTTEIFSEHRGRLLQVPLIPGTVLKIGDTIALFDKSSITELIDSLSGVSKAQGVDYKSLKAQNENDRKQRSILISLQCLDTLIEYYAKKQNIQQRELDLGVINKETFNQTQMKLMEANAQRSKLLMSLKEAEEEFTWLNMNSNMEVKSNRTQKSVWMSSLVSQTSKVNAVLLDNIAKPGSMMYTGMSLMEVSLQDSLYISYITSLEHLKYLKIGSTINIDFEDGTSCKGTIVSVQRDETKSRILSDNSLILCKILPNAGTIKSLVPYKDMPVNLTFSKLQ